VLKVLALLNRGTPQLDRNLIDNLNPKSFQRGHTFGPVREQADAPQV
jgi:hypothetical protein